MKSSTGQFLWHTHSYINEYIRFADAKSAVVIAWSSTLMGVLIANDVHDVAFDDQRNVLIRAAVVVSFLLLSLSFVLAIWAILPRLGTKSVQGLIFWESVLGYPSAKEFETAVNSATELEMDRELTTHIYDLSCVCRAKYSRVNSAILCATIGSVGSALLLVMSG